MHNLTIKLKKKLPNPENILTSNIFSSNENKNLMIHFHERYSYITLISKVLNPNILRT